LDEQTVQQTEEERDDDEEHQRGQVAKEQDEHEPSFDSTGGVEALGALRRAEPVSMIPQDDERTSASVAGSLEIARDRRKRGQSNSGRLTCKRRKERRFEGIGP